MKKYVHFYGHSSCSRDFILQRRNMSPLVPCKALILLVVMAPAHCENGTKARRWVISWVKSPALIKYLFLRIFGRPIESAYPGYWGAFENSNLKRI